MISLISFLLCTPESSITSSSDEPTTADVISGSSVRSTFNVTEPEVPPPSNNVPATTASISPASLVKLNAPVELLYEMSPLALNNPLTCESLSAIVGVPLVPPPVKPLPAVKPVK